MNQQLLPWYDFASDGSDYFRAKNSPQRRMHPCRCQNWSICLSVFIRQSGTGGALASDHWDRRLHCSPRRFATHAWNIVDRLIRKSVRQTDSLIRSTLLRRSILTYSALTVWIAALTYSINLQRFSNSEVDDTGWITILLTISVLTVIRFYTVSTRKIAESLLTITLKTVK